jgi:hypothetical protein
VDRDRAARHPTPLIAYSAGPDTPAEDALKLLASWAATTHDEQHLPEAEKTDTHVH